MNDQTIDSPMHAALDPSGCAGAYDFEIFCPSDQVDCQYRDGIAFLKDNGFWHEIAA